MQMNNVRTFKNIEKIRIILDGQNLCTTQSETGLRILYGVPSMWVPHGFGKSELLGQCVVLDIILVSCTVLKYNIAFF